MLASMDDETLFGPEFHRLGFGEAVERGLLTDYKVLVLAVDERVRRRDVPAAAGRRRTASCSSTMPPRSSAAGTGWPSSRPTPTAPASHADAAPMRRAVAFAGDIKDSKKIARAVPPTSSTSTSLHERRRRRVRRPASTARSATSTAPFNALRAQHQARLAQGAEHRRAPAASSPTPAACPKAWTCRRWTRCMFLNPRKSQSSTWCSPSAG